MKPDAVSSALAQFGIGARTWQALRPLFRPRVLERGEHLVTAGQTFRSFALVVRGFLRIYFVSHDGKESTKFFRGPGELIGPYAEILKRTRATTFIQALERSEVWVAPYDPIAERAERSVTYANLLRRVAEMNYLEKCDREFELLTLSAEERYHSLRALRGEWMDAIPLYHLASYLGVTPVALSRIRRRGRRR